MRQIGTRVRSQAPTSTAIPDTTSSADHEPMNTDSGSPVRAASPAVSSWLRSPHSAVKRMTKLVAKTLSADVGCCSSARLAISASSSASSACSCGARGQAALDHDHRTDGEEHEGHPEDEPLRQQGQQAAGRDGDQHLDEEGRGHAEPDPQPAEAGGEDEGGDEGLVRQLRREDQGEGRHDDREVDHGPASGADSPAASLSMSGRTSQASVGHTVGVGIRRVPDHGAGVTSSRRQICRAANS